MFKNNKINIVRILQTTAILFLIWGCASDKTKEPVLSNKTNPITQAEENQDHFNEIYKPVNLDISEVSLTDTARKPLNFAQSKKILIFRHSYYGCDVCTDSVYSLLSSTFKTQDIFKKLYVITNYSTNKEALVWRSNYPEFTKVFYSLSPINIEPEKNFNSYFFIYDLKEKSVEKIHFPEKSQIQLTKIYLDDIANSFKI